MICSSLKSILRPNCFRTSILIRNGISMSTIYLINVRKDSLGIGREDTNIFVLRMIVVLKQIG